MSWYGGSGAKLPIPTPNAVTGLIECNWLESYRVIVPNSVDKTDWASGIYLVKLSPNTPSAPNAGTESCMTFVVRDDSSRSTYLYQSTATTSQAYDNWGGQSMYPYNSTGGAARKVSFNRPYARDGFWGGAGNFLNWEIYFINFLEREGYDVSYLSNIDLHTNGAQLLNHNAFLVAGHEEYGSYPMKSAAHAAQAQGVQFFYRQRGLLAGALQAQFKRRAEPHDDIVVSNATSWVYSGTGVSNATHFTGLLGYEIEAASDNGFSPPQLRKIAESPDPWSGAHMATYTTAAGAIVFATGSMQWNWGLDNFSYRNLENAAVKQATRNVLARFAAAPLRMPRLLDGNRPRKTGQAMPKKHLLFMLTMAATCGAARAQTQALSTEAWRAVTDARGVQVINVECRNGVFDPREIVVKNSLPVALSVRTSEPSQEFVSSFTPNKAIGKEKSSHRFTPNRQRPLQAGLPEARRGCRTTAKGSDARARRAGQAPQGRSVQPKAQSDIPSSGR